MLFYDRIRRVAFAILALLSFAAWAPWVEADNGADVVRRAGYSFAPSHIRDASELIVCDGVSSRRVPFGSLVSDCGDHSWIVTFWNGVFRLS